MMPLLMVGWRKTDLSAIPSLLSHEDKPLSTSDFLVNVEPELAALVENVLALFVQDAGKNGQASTRENALELRKELDDDIGIQISKQEIDGTVAYRIDGPAKRPEVGL